MESYRHLDHMKPFVSTDLLRQKIRDYTLRERSANRATVSDALRLSLGGLKEDRLLLTEKDVQGLAQRIKRRKHATVEDMYRLSYSFLQSNENINAFVNAVGPLQVLVKELTGANFERQISAMECFCNLSLGEQHVCEKVVNLAGSYFVTYLDSLEKRLKQTSLWILCNLLATSNKCAEMLLKMQLIRKLCIIYACDESVIFCEDAAIALQLLCLKTKHLLTEDDFKFLIEKMIQKSPTAEGSEYLLQIVFNCDILNSNRVYVLKVSFLIYLINFSLNSLNTIRVLDSNSSRLRVIYAIRILANLLANHSKTFDILTKQLEDHWQRNLEDFFKCLFNYNEKEISLEILWLLRNLLDAAQRRNVSSTKIDRWLDSLVK